MLILFRCFFCGLLRDWFCGAPLLVRRVTPAINHCLVLLWFCITVRIVNWLAWDCVFAGLGGVSLIVRRRYEDCAQSLPDSSSPLLSLWGWLSGSMPVVRQARFARVAIAVREAVARASYQPPIDAKEQS